MFSKLKKKKLIKGIIEKHRVIFLLSITKQWFPLEIQNLAFKVGTIALFCLEMDSKWEPLLCFILKKDDNLASPQKKYIYKKKIQNLAACLIISISRGKTKTKTLFDLEVTYISTLITQISSLKLIT